MRLFPLLDRSVIHGRSRSNPLNRKNIMYTRFSSDMQRDDSCEDQEREVRRGLEQRGIDPGHFEVIHDQAVSGTRTDRPQFEQLRRMIGRGEIGILAVDDQSRFSRPIPHPL